MKNCFLRVAVVLSLLFTGMVVPPLFAQDFMEGWQGGLSKSTYSQVRFRMYQVTMPDGVNLSVAVWRPDVEGERFPVIMIATPYNKLAPANIADADYFAARGYAFVAYDLRGRYDSQGQAYLYGAQDGDDLSVMQTWAGEQPWSTGKIGMYGGSYLGFIQWEGALHHNTHLTALIPQVSPDDHYDNVFPSGAFQLSNSLALLYGCCGARTNVPADPINWQELYEHLPIKDDIVWAGIPNPGLWNDMLSHPDRDSYWVGPGERIAPGEIGPGKYDQIRVPTFNISGWFDQVSQATINNFIGMVKYGPPELSKYHKLIMGPWTHGGLFKTGQGELTYPNQAAPNGNEWKLRWFDHWLKGLDNGFDRQPPVYIYVMGANTWRNECEWPLKRAEYTKYYLHSQGRANSVLGDGILDKKAPEQESNDKFTYDPAQPVPTLGGNVSMHPPRVGPYDQRAIELRTDVLVYTTPPLDQDTEVTGPVVLHLFASTDRTDTDFTGKLVDVHPDGYAQILVEGIIRGRHQKSFRTDELLTPDKPYEFYVDLWSTSNLFLKGHRIRIEVSSSDFPKYDRNPNTGHKFGEDTAKEMLIAHQTIYHNSEYTSYVTLPIIPTGSRACQGESE